MAALRGQVILSLQHRRAGMFAFELDDNVSRLAGQTSRIRSLPL